MAGFQAKYPNIKVQVESVPDSYEQKIFTSLAASNAPTWAIFYNKTLFDNVPYPNDDWMYDEFLSAAQKLIGNGVYGFVTEDKNTYHFM